MASPVTIPDAEPIDACVSLELQWPPETSLLNVAVAPGQTLIAPLMAAVAFTVTEVNARLLQKLVPVVYVIVVLPEVVDAANMPDEEPITPTAVLLVLHNPPETELESEVELPPTTAEGPDIDPIAGIALTVSCLTEKQVPGIV